MNHGDTRSVSSAVSYSLIVVITLALTAGLVIGADSLVAGQRDETVSNQVDVIGQRLASTIQTVDRMTATSEQPVTASVTRHFPERIAGAQYRVIISPDSSVSGVNRYQIRVEAVDTGISTTLSITTRTPLSVDFPSSPSEERLNGGSIRVALTDPDARGSGDPPRLEVQDA